MNDPDLDGPIHEAASEANDTLGKLKDDGAGNEDTGTTNATMQLHGQDKAQAMPTRWWYASTAFPLVAGTFGPLANAFSICALVENWRVEVPPGGTEEHGIDIKDPKLLIAVNAVSLVFALIANLSLLLNMAKRVRFEIAQPITILGFWAASVLLIGLLSYASTTAFDAPNVQNQALTQAYYYGLFAASLYQIISYLMCITVWGAYRGSYSKDFELTVAQRTLMLQTISFLVYLLVGALIYSHVENWKFLDAVYFIDFTLLTVGIGDYTPVTHLGRSLLFPIAVGGIITIGLVVSSIRSLVLDRGAEKLSARMTEKARSRVVKQVSTVKTQKKLPVKPVFRLNSDIAKDLTMDPVDDHVAELERRKTEFEAMRAVQDMAARERRYMGLAVSTLAFAILWFVGAFVFFKTERNQQWTYFQSLYFSYTSIITIGYGDFYPMSNSGKPFFVFWSLLAVPTLTILISSMGDTVVKGIKDATIWLGEISFLPSTDGRTRERLKIGVYRATFGKIRLVQPEVADQEKGDFEEEQDEDWANFKQLHPGLAKVFDASDRKKLDHKNIQILDRLAEAWGASEQEDEKEARSKQDQRAQAEHHYRHLLISQIPKVYADTKLTTPKKYSYVEWSFYLRLIGEDESDSSLHRRPHAKPKAHSHHGNKHTQAAHEQAPLQPKSPGSRARDKDQHTIPKWSWIGQHSPLMQDKDEAEWILERLFQRLEESLRAQSREFERTHGDMDGHTEPALPDSE
ncbi:hypothetical protein OHC33_003813 [Knufia fluminis]|uniref:Potassium channel domain-containing protein n=1 Tax=Knufia fluminis TaxID=191047 RepID=A0AAN8EGJ5_9EURO|nr:hypothetical protein OHC33_003813 [Knufia fluminis]